MPLTEPSSSETDVVAVGPGWERATLAGRSSRDAVAARVPLPCRRLLPPLIFLSFSPVCLFLPLVILSAHPFHSSLLAAPLHPNILFIADGDFHFLTLKATDFISERAKSLQCAF